MLWILTKKMGVSVREHKDAVVSVDRARLSGLSVDRVYDWRTGIRVIELPQRQEKSLGKWWKLGEIKSNTAEAFSQSP